jgi:hypothetical protein
LNPQELRNALFFGSFNDLIIQLAGNAMFNDVWEVLRYEKHYREGHIDAQGPDTAALENITAWSRSKCSLLARIANMINSPNRSLREMSDQTNPSQTDSLPRVAVVAVHGVNTNEAFETARSIARMLLRHGASGLEYPDFKETAEHILVDRLNVASNGAAGAESGQRHSWFDERAPSIRRAQQRGRDKDTVSEAPLDLQYMSDQLRQYKVEGSDAFYDTIRIDGVTLMKHLLWCRYG